MTDPNREPNRMRPEIEHPHITEIEHTTEHPENPRVDNQNQIGNREQDVQPG